MYDDAKNLDAVFDYTPYGELLHGTNRTATTEQFTGHTWDPDAGMYFAPYRYYSPGIARWITQDPLGMVDGPNVYAYAPVRPDSRETADKGRKPLASLPRNLTGYVTPSGSQGVLRLLARYV